MKTDVTIDRVRAARSKISFACAHDPEKLVAYYLEMQKKLTSRMVAGKRRMRKASPHKHMRSSA